MQNYIMNRVDSDFKAQRMELGKLNMKSEYQEKFGSGFTHLLPFHYSSPRTFSALSALASNPMGKQFYYFRMIKQLFDELVYLSTLDEHKNIMIFFGDDFKYKDAAKDYGSIDQVMIFAASNPHYFSSFELTYSLPNKYFKKVAEEGRKIDTSPR